MGACKDTNRERLQLPPWQGSGQAMHLAVHERQSQNKALQLLARLVLRTHGVGTGQAAAGRRMAACGSWLHEALYVEEAPTARGRPRRVLTTSTRQVHRLNNAWRTKWPLFADGHSSPVFGKTAQTIALLASKICAIMFIACAR
jgi:hypothetical protein